MGDLRSRSSCCAPGVLFTLAPGKLSLEKSSSRRKGRPPTGPPLPTRYDVVGPRLVASIRYTPPFGSSTRIIPSLRLHGKRTVSQILWSRVHLEALSTLALTPLPLSAKKVGEE